MPEKLANAAGRFDDAHAELFAARRAFDQRKLELASVLHDHYKARNPDVDDHGIDRMVRTHLEGVMAKRLAEEDELEKGMRTEMEGGGCRD